MNRYFFYGFLTILILLFMSQTHAQDQPSEGEGAILCIDVFDDKDICNCLAKECPHEVGGSPEPSCFKEKAKGCGVDPKLLQGLN